MLGTSPRKERLREKTDFALLAQTGFALILLGTVEDYDTRDGLRQLVAIGNRLHRPRLSDGGRDSGKGSGATHEARVSVDASE